MHKIYQYTITLFFLFVLLITTKANNDTCNSKTIIVEQTCLYDELQLATLGLSKNIFERAIAEWNVLCIKKHIKKKLLKILITRYVIIIHLLF